MTSLCVGGCLDVDCFFWLLEFEKACLLWLVAPIFAQRALEIELPFSCPSSLRRSRLFSQNRSSWPPRLCPMDSKEHDKEHIDLDLDEDWQKSIVGNSENLDVVEQTELPAITPQKPGRLTVSKHKISIDALAEAGLRVEELRDFDQDGDGTVNIVELVAFAKKHKELHKNFSFVKVILLLVLLAMICFLLLCFGASVVAIQITKEMTTSGNTLMPSSCPADQPELCNKPIATGPTKRESRRLSSTMPDEAFEELKSVSLNLPHQNGETVKVALDISSYERRMVSTSRCGSLVDLETIHGTLMLDDAELFASVDFVEKMNSRGYDIDDETPLASADGARRLSVGSDIAGMFNFVAEYNYTCESQARPLQNLEPPFSFTIDSYQLCEASTCFSRVFGSLNITDLGLPGLCSDPYAVDTLVKGKFIKSREQVYALSKEKIITVQTWPNYPMMSLLSAHDFANKTLVQKQIFNNSQASYCSTRPSKEEEDMMTNLDDFVIAAVGSTSYKSEPDRKFNKYILYHRDHPHREEAYVEYWEEKATGLPHKYFLPNLADSPRAYFTSFKNHVDEEEFAGLQQRIDMLDCHGPDIFGLSAPVMDDDEQTPATENDTTLEFYRALNEVCMEQGCHMLVTSDWSQDYWAKVFGAPTLHPEETLPPDSLARRLLTDLRREDASHHNSTDRRLFEQIPSPNPGVTYEKVREVKKSFGTSKYGFNFDMELGRYKRAGIIIAGLTSLDASAAGSATIGVPPLYVSLECGGYAKGWTLFALEDGSTAGDFEGELYLKIAGGVNMIIGKMEVGIEGRIQVAKALGARALPAVDVTGSITGNIDVEILFGLFKATAWATFRASFFNLGPTFDDDHKRDDAIQVSGSAGFKMKIFWVFTIRFQLQLDVIPRRSLWNSNPEKLAGVDSSDIGPNCVRISEHDRDCEPRSSIQFKGFVPLDPMYAWNDAENLQMRSTSSMYEWDRSMGSMVFRHATGARVKEMRCSIIECIFSCLLFVPTRNLPA